MAIEKERVVITGIGPVSAVGTGVSDFWQGLASGRSGISRIKGFPEKYESACKIAGQIHDFDPLNYLDAKQVRRTDRFIQFAIAAAQLAMEDAKLDGNWQDPERVGVMVGSAAGGFSTFELQHTTLLEKGAGRVSPFTVPAIIVNMPAGWISILHKAKGPNSCAVTACATSAHCIGDAARLIERGDADVMFAGGTEAVITPFAIAGFAAARTLSTRNDEPEKASRPYDLDRDGFVMAEGACVLMLESLTHAQKRGARIYAEVAGYGQSGDAFDIVQPCGDGDGARRAMLMALKDASMQPQEIDYINAHGTSTPLGDRAETQAIIRVFGEHAQSHKLKVSSTKSMTGHLLGAAGGIEAAASALAIYHSLIPPTINLDNQDPECTLDYVPHKALSGVKVDAVVSNSFGFGGHNASLLLKRFST